MLNEAKNAFEAWDLRLLFCKPWKLKCNARIGGGGIFYIFYLPRFFLSYYVSEYAWIFIGLAEK